MGVERFLSGRNQRGRRSCVIWCESNTRKKRIGSKLGTVTRSSASRLGGSQTSSSSILGESFGDCVPLNSTVNWSPQKVIEAPYQDSSPGQYGQLLNADVDSREGVAEAGDEFVLAPGFGQAFLNSVDDLVVEAEVDVVDGRRQLESTTVKSRSPTTQMA